MIREGRRSDLEGLLDGLARLDATGEAADPRYRLRPDWRAVQRERLADLWFGRFLPFPACLVDERDGGIAGFVGGAPRADHPVLDEAPTAKIEVMWVEEPHRRLGIGRALVAEWIRRATAAGYPRIEVSTLAKDERAVAFWRGVGFDDLRVVLAR